MTRRQQVIASWRIESVQVLMWALNVIESLPPYGSGASHDLLGDIPAEEAKGFIRTARLRDSSEIAGHATWQNCGTGAAAPAS